MDRLQWLLFPAVPPVFEAGGYLLFLRRGHLQEIRCWKTRRVHSLSFAVLLRMGRRSAGEKKTKRAFSVFVFRV